MDSAYAKMLKNDLYGLAVSRNLEVTKSMTKAQLIEALRGAAAMTSTASKSTAAMVKRPSDGRMVVRIPAEIQELVRGLPELRREYGGIIDFKLDGSFETMSVVYGEGTYIKGGDIPDYEVMWHNHPRAPGGQSSVPSFADVRNIINSKHAQYSLIFTELGTFIQWVPNKKESQGILASAGKDINENFVMFISMSPGKTIEEKYIYAIRSVLKVETMFAKWGQPYELHIFPYEPTVHAGRKSS
jgi:hypothetical protein